MHACFRIMPSFEIHFVFPISSIKGCIVFSLNRSDDPSLSRLYGKLVFSSSFHIGTPRMVHTTARNRSRLARGIFLFLFALRFESRALSYPHPGSRNSFLSFYPVVLRAPSIPYAPPIKFFRYSPVRYTCCQ